MEDGRSNETKIELSGLNAQLFRVDGKMDAAKYRATLEENILETARDFSGGSPSSRITTYSQSCI